MGAFDQLWQPAIGFDKIVSVTFRMRRSEAQSFETLDLMNGFEQLHKSRFAVLFRNLALAVAGDDLAEQRDFLNAAADQFAAFGDNVGNSSAPLSAARIRNDAKG